MNRPTPKRGTEDDVVGRRIAATLIDTVVVFAVYYAGLRVLSGQLALGAPETVAGFLFWFVFSVFGFTPLLTLHGFSPYWFLSAVAVWAVYAAALEAAVGQTPGKRIAGIVVAMEDGAACTLEGAVVRNALRAVDAIGFYLLGLLVLGLTGRRQRVGDLAAGTVVLATERRPAAPV